MTKKPWTKSRQGPVYCHRTPNSKKPMPHLGLWLAKSPIRIFHRHFGHTQASLRHPPSTARRSFACAPASNATRLGRRQLHAWRPIPKLVPAMRTQWSGHSRGRAQRTVTWLTHTRLMLPCCCRPPHNAASQRACSSGWRAWRPAWRPTRTESPHCLTLSMTWRRANRPAAGKRSGGSAAWCLKILSLCTVWHTGARTFTFSNEKINCLKEKGGETLITTSVYRAESLQNGGNYQKENRSALKIIVL